MVTCPTCGNEASVAFTQYGTRHECCGLRSWNNKPLVCEATLRLREAAHKSFDEIWKCGIMSRTAAYKWLAEQMKMKPEECHIARMDMFQCEHVIELSDRKIEEYYGDPYEDDEIR